MDNNSIFEGNNGEGFYDHKSVITKEGGTNWQNPFEKNLLEDWRLEEDPRNYREMVACFFAPDFMNKLESADVKPKILMGGRGTGKSHILRMLSCESVVNSIKLAKLKDHKESIQKIKIEFYKDYDKPYFGTYLKATVFLPLSTTSITYLTKDQLKSLFEHAFNLYISMRILYSLKFLMDNCIDIPREKEWMVCSKLEEKFRQWVIGKNFAEILGSLSNEIVNIQEIIKRWPFYSTPQKLIDGIKFTTAPDFIIEFFGVINKEILGNKLLFILLDEYDELDEYQQEFINRLIRTRTLAFRIASKIGGIKTLEYASGKELEEIHDYDPIIPLHFENSRGGIIHYRELLKNIFLKRLTVYGEYKIKEPEKLLPSPTLTDEKLTDEEIQQELKNIHANLKKKRRIQDFEKYWKNVEGHYKEAAIYRLLRKKGRDKLYAGFDEYVSLSSGIVRQFLLLCQEAFRLSRDKGIDIEKGVPIPVKIQSEAALNVSKNLLEKEYARNVPKGIKLIQLIRDLGRILEAKLYWSSEPEANRFELIDAPKLLDDKYALAKDLLDHGLKMPHFISERAFKPKQPIYSPSFTFSLNGIFAPVLGIPTAKRWRTPLTVNEFNSLCMYEKREDILRKVIEEIKGKKRAVRGRRKIEKEMPIQVTLLDQPINLANCPVTGGGCNGNLIEYHILKGNVKAFLACDFGESWVKDVRVWVKEIMSDNFKIRCVDVDDFPNLGYILCKICSCVRQIPIGLFEITELNSNVIFELGMAAALNKLTFMLVYPKKIPEKFRSSYPPRPLSGIEYIPYELNKNAIIQVIRDKILPIIDGVTNKIKYNGWCWVIRGECPYEVHPQQVLTVALPSNSYEPFFEELAKLLRELLKDHKIEFLKPAKSLSELCQICRGIKKSSFCIIDTTCNDISTLFALGVAFGKDKKFLQLHNISLCVKRPLTDLRPWAIEYKNINELKSKLHEELQERER